MPSLASPIKMPMPFARSVAIAALMGATMLATPLTPARAGSATNAAIQLAQAPNTQSPAAAGATQGKVETVEQRITDLHTALKITPDQEKLWNGVAQDMRENAVAMDKLIAETGKTPPQSMSAVDDLKTYQKFAQAHVDGLKNLLSHFEGLYAAMPDAQKKIADDVFRSTRKAASTASNG
jgi:periplasmic protein CpxP/Spy